MALAKDPFDAWRVPASHGGDEGSYAPNGWMCNPPAGMDSLWGRGPAADYWRTYQVRGAHDILHERAATIDDAPTRRSYLENVSVHREILREFERTR